MKDKYINIIEQLGNLEKELEVTRDYDEKSWTNEMYEMYEHVQAVQQFMIRLPSIENEKSLLTEIKEGDILFDKFYNEGKPYFMHRFPYMHEYGFTTPGVVRSLLSRGKVFQSGIPGIHQSSISRWIKGGSKITIEKAAELARLLGYKIHFFFTKKNEK